MEVKFLTQKDYTIWDSFCLGSDDAWYWHTTDWLEINIHYKPELKAESHSFYIEKNDTIITICPLIVITRNGVKEFSYGGGYGFTPAYSNELTKNEREKIQKFVFQHIDSLAGSLGVVRMQMRFPVLNHSTFQKNYKPYFNYL